MAVRMRPGLMLLTRMLRLALELLRRACCAPPRGRPSTPHRLPRRRADGAPRRCSRRSPRRRSDLRRFGSSTWVRMNGAVKIHVQHPAPGGDVVLLQRGAIAEQRGGMHQSVELAEFLADGFRQAVVLGGRGGREIEHRDGGLRARRAPRSHRRADRASRRCGPTRMTLAPARAQSSESARPKPPLAPVIRIGAPGEQVRQRGPGVWAATSVPSMLRRPARGAARRGPGEVQIRRPKAPARLASPRECLAPSAASTSRWRSAGRSLARQPIGRAREKPFGPAAQARQIGLQPRAARRRSDPHPRCRPRAIHRPGILHARGALRAGNRRAIRAGMCCAASAATARCTAGSEPPRQVAREMRGGHQGRCPKGGAVRLELGAALERRAADLPRGGLERRVKRRKIHVGGPRQCREEAGDGMQRRAAREPGDLFAPPGELDAPRPRARSPGSISARHSALKAYMPSKGSRDSAAANSQLK